MDVENKCQKVQSLSSVHTDLVLKESAQRVLDNDKQFKFGGQSSFCVRDFALFETPVRSGSCFLHQSVHIPLCHLKYLTS